MSYTNTDHMSYFAKFGVKPRIETEDYRRRAIERAMEKSVEKSYCVRETPIICGLPLEMIERTRSSIITPAFVMERPSTRVVFASPAPSAPPMPPVRVVFAPPPSQITYRSSGTVLIDENYGVKPTILLFRNRHTRLFGLMSASQRSGMDPKETATNETYINSAHMFHFDNNILSRKACIFVDGKVMFVLRLATSSGISISTFKDNLSILRSSGIVTEYDDMTRIDPDVLEMGTMTTSGTVYLKDVNKNIIDISGEDYHILMETISDGLLRTAPIHPFHIERLTTGMVSTSAYML